MQYTRETAVKRLLEAYRAYYNIEMFEGEHAYLTAVCEFFERSERFMVSQKVNLWRADCEEFIYLFTMENMTSDIYRSCMDYVNNDWEKRAHIGPGHMYTYVTPVFVCDTCEAEALKMLRRCRIYKSFRFSLHGWMEYHTAVLQIQKDCLISTNRHGRCVEKVMKNVLFQMKKKKRRRFL